MVLDSSGTLKPSDTMTYADINIGLPTLIICLQVVPFAFFFYHAYSIKPYTTLNASVKDTGDSQQFLNIVDSEAGSHFVKRYQGGPFGIHAWLALFNPMEFFQDIKSTFDMFRDSKMMQHKETGTSPNS